MASLEQQWRELSAEFHAAKEVLDEAWFPVLRKQAAIANGTSTENPTPDEEAQVQAANDVLDDIKERMDEFKKAHLRQR